MSNAERFEEIVAELEHDYAEKQLLDFWAKHQNGRNAKTLGLAGAGSRKLAGALAGIAANKAAAITSRKMGETNTALMYEGFADRIYAEARGKKNPRKRGSGGALKYPSYPILYRGYWIKHNALSGDLWVEKDGFSIVAPDKMLTASKARAIIDDLLGPVGNPRKRAAPSTPEEHQLEVARRVLRTPDAMAAVMGGMSKAEARKLLALAKLRAAKNPRKCAASAGKMTLFAHNPSHEIYVQIMRNGRWLDVDGYGSEDVARAMATVLGKAGYTARAIRR